jgi:hypothetical protein
MAWIRGCEQTLQHEREFNQRYPGVILLDAVGEAQRRLEALRALGHGWVDFAADVSARLEREFRSRA